MKSNKQIIIDELDKWFQPTNGNKLDIEIAKERHNRIAANLSKKLIPQQKPTEGEISEILYNCVLENQEEYPVEEILEKYTKKLSNLISNDKGLIMEEGIVVAKNNPETDDVCFTFKGKDIQEDFNDYVLENNLCGENIKITITKGEWNE